MKLEEATKEELIWWIRQHTFEISHALRHFESEILFRGYKDYNAKAEIAGKQYEEAFIAHKALLEPYAGKPIRDIPVNIVHQAAELENAMKTFQEAQMHFWKLADKCL